MTAAPDTAALVAGQAEPARFVVASAEATAQDVGFSWVAKELAPSTYQQLRAAFQASQSTGAPLPVSSLYCDTTVYPRASDNVAFRFWHDVHHVRFGLSFRLEDELELALWHLNEAGSAGLRRGSVAHELLSVDLLGQIMLMGLIGRFPLDQKTFVATCFELGLAPGLLAEIRRLPSAPPQGMVAS